MRTTTITRAKSGLSALIDEVKAGESIVITDRGVPVARLEPIATSIDPTGRVERLVRAGLARPGRGTVPVGFLDGPVTPAPAGMSLVDAVVEERRSGW